MDKDIKFTNKFWVYSNKFAIIDSFNTIWKIGEKEEMINNCDEMNNNEALSFYTPFTIIQITKETSLLF